MDTNNEVQTVRRSDMKKDDNKSILKSSLNSNFNTSKITNQQSYEITNNYEQILIAEENKKRPGVTEVPLNEKLESFIIESEIGKKLPILKKTNKQEKLHNLINSPHVKNSLSLNLEYFNNNIGKIKTTTISTDIITSMILIPKVMKSIISVQLSLIMWKVEQQQSKLKIFIKKI